MTKRIGVDIDGVLAEFNRTFGKLLIEVAGVDNLPGGYDKWIQQDPAIWDYDKEAYPNDRYPGVRSGAWNRVAASGNFWWLLPAREEFTLELADRLNAATYAYDIYFVTNRAGLAAKYQTERWLEYHGIERPTVLLAENKGAVCKALRLDAYLDDKYENIVSVFEETVPRDDDGQTAGEPTTRGYLLHKPYNSIGYMSVDHRVYARIGNLVDFFDVEGL